MKSLFPHTEHNATKRILSLILLLSLEFSTFAHAGMLSIMPIEKQWLSTIQNPSILDLFKSSTPIAPVVPVATRAILQRGIYTAPKIIQKIATPIQKSISSMVPDDGWLDTNRFVESNSVPTIARITGTGVSILMRDASGRITSMPLADLYSSPLTLVNTTSQISTPILS